MDTLPFKITVQHLFDNLKVSDYIIPEAKAWNVPFLLSIFDQHIVNQVVNTPLYPSVHHDRLVWTKENNGEYSIRSAYKMCMQELVTRLNCDPFHYRTLSESKDSFSES